MKKIIASLLFVCIFAGLSSADVIYNTSNGRLGVISTTLDLVYSDPVIRYTDAGNDSFVTSYANGSNTNIMLVKRTASNDIANISGDRALIFNLYDMSRTLNEFTLENIYDTLKTGYSYNGNSVFFASRLTNAIYELDAETFEYKRGYYDIDGTDSLKNFAVSPGYVYILVNTIESEDVLLWLDGQMSSNAGAMIEVPENIECMAVLASGTLALGYNEGVLIFNNNVFRDALVTDSSVKAICMDTNSGSYGFYYITQREASAGIYVNELWHFNGINTTMIAVRNSESATPCQLVCDIYGGIVSAMMANEIFIVPLTSDTSFGEFDSNALNGIPVSITTSSILTSESYGSSNSSGCSITGAGLILFALAAIKFAWRSKS